MIHRAPGCDQSPDWQRGTIDRKLAIFRDTYGMLNDEAQAARSETLEIAIVVLIVAEIVMALIKGT